MLLQHLILSFGKMLASIDNQAKPFAAAPHQTLTAGQLLLPPLAGEGWLNKLNDRCPANSKVGEVFNRLNRLDFIYLFLSVSPQLSYIFA